MSNDSESFISGSSLLWRSTDCAKILLGLRISIQNYWMTFERFYFFNWSYETYFVGAKIPISTDFDKVKMSNAPFGMKWSKIYWRRKYFTTFRISSKTLPFKNNQIISSLLNYRRTWLLGVLCSRYPTDGHSMNVFIQHEYNAKRHAIMNARLKCIWRILFMLYRHTSASKTQWFWVCSCYIFFFCVGFGDCIV